MVRSGLRIIRWLLILPAGILGWFAALFLGVYTDGFIFSLCPEDMIVSGACTARWYLRLSPLILPTFSSLAAILVVVLPTLTAPSHRKRVAVAAYLCGAVAALIMVGDNLLRPGIWFALSPLWSALITGFMAMLVLRQLMHPSAS